MSKDNASADKQMRDMEETLKAFQATADAAISERDAEIAALKAQLASGTSRKYQNAVPATVNGSQYQVVHGIIWEGKKLSPAEIAENQELLELLIESKSSAVNPA